MTLPSDSDRTRERLAGWGIVGVIGDYRGARIETEARIERTEQATVTLIKRRPSFTVDCLDCGPAPHVSPDDASIGVCLRCGRDRWL